MASVPIRVNYSLSPRLNPVTFQGKEPSHQVITYTVQANDTPIGIADKFGIGPETILGGNPRLSEEASALQTGTVLTILPIDGVLHDVQQGETLERLSTYMAFQLKTLSATRLIIWNSHSDFTRVRKSWFQVLSGRYLFGRHQRPVLDLQVRLQQVLESNWWRLEQARSFGL